MLWDPGGEKKKQSARTQAKIQLDKHGKNVDEGEGTLTLLTVKASASSSASLLLFDEKNQQ